jgi:hypothetical protein
VLRQFAALWLMFLAGMAALVLRPTARIPLDGDWNLLILVVCGILGLGQGLWGLVQPQAIRWLYVSCMITTFPIGWAVSRSILAVLFYGLFTPLALFFRLIGRDELQRHRPPERSTFWSPKSATCDLRSYLRQF